MEKFEKKLKQILGAATGMTLAMIVIGVLFIVFPGRSLDVVRWIVVIILAFGGFSLIMSDLTSKVRGGWISGLVTGGFLMLISLIIAVNPGIFDLVPILLGAYMIISSISKIAIARSLREVSLKTYNATLITNIISIICGIILVIHPGQINDIIMIILGVTLIIYGISDIIDIAILRTNIDSLTNNIKVSTKEKKASAKNLDKSKNLKDIKEAEIVEEKKTSKKK